MTKEEAWLAWMKAAKTTDTPIETDFELIKKTSWWQAFEAGWDLASVNLNGWDQAYAMGLKAGKEVARADEREACAKVVEQYCGAWDDEGYALAQAIRANRSQTATSVFISNRGEK